MVVKNAVEIDVGKKEIEISLTKKEISGDPQRVFSCRVSAHEGRLSCSVLYEVAVLFRVYVHPICTDTRFCRVPLVHEVDFAF